MGGSNNDKGTTWISRSQMDLRPSQKSELYLEYLGQKSKSVTAIYIPGRYQHINMAETDVKETAGPQIELSAEKEAEYERITRNLAELTSGDIIRKVLSEGKTVKCYWGKLARSRGEARTQADDTQEPLRPVDVS